MSVQSAKDFLVKIATDDDLSTKAADAQRAALMGLARHLGYTFSDDDLSTAMDDVDALDELSVDELHNVAGGRMRVRLDS